MRTADDFIAAFLRAGLLHPFGDPAYLTCPVCGDGDVTLMRTEGEWVEGTGDDLVEPECSSYCATDTILRKLEKAAEEAANREKVADGSTLLKVTRASEVRVEPVSFLLADRVPVGALTVLAGDPGLGKSTWSCALAAGVTAGRLGSPAPVLIANAEDSPAHVVVPRLAAAGANLERVEFFASLVGDPVTGELGEHPFTLPHDVADLEAHARKVGAKLVVIDPLNAHLGEKVSTKSDHSVRRALAPLASMAQRLGIAVVVVAHLNKSQGTDALYRVGGSIGFVGGARSLLLFTRDPEDPDGEAGDRRALGHVKSNWGKLAPTLLYAHGEATVTVGGSTVDTNRLDLLGESDVAGTALLGASGDDSPSSQHERAVELLADMLGDGQCRRSKDVKAAAHTLGIPERTLKRAAQDVGVSMESMGFPRVTYWSLPSGANPFGPTGDGPTGPTGRIPANTGDSASPPSQSGHLRLIGPTGENGPTGESRRHVDGRPYDSPPEWWPHGNGGGS